MSVNLYEVTSTGSRTVRFTWPTNTQENSPGYTSAPDVPQGQLTKAATSTWQADPGPQGQTRTVQTWTDGSARRYSNDWMTRTMAAGGGGSVDD